MHSTTEKNAPLIVRLLFIESAHFGERSMNWLPLILRINSMIKKKELKKKNNSKRFWLNLLKRYQQILP